MGDSSTQVDDNKVAEDVRFTYEWYETLLEYLTEQGYRFPTFQEEAEEPFVFIRHDVDWSPRKAVKIAELEAEAGITTTFCFLITSPFYNVFNRKPREAIQRIEGLGHEIALHFSTHQYWNDEPTLDKIERAAAEEMSTLEQLTDGSVDVVSFHNPPNYVLGERFDPFISTYEPRFFDDIEYCADSNQRWRETHPFKPRVPDELQLLTHPLLWDVHDGWATDRLRTERDYLFQKISRHLKSSDRTWKGLYGLDK